MNRRSRHLVVLTVAVVTAAIASFAVYRALLQRPRSLADVPHQSVVVAARSLPIGTELTENDVKLVAWPAATPVPGAIGDVKSAVNRGLLTAVLQNEPITVNKLAAIGTAGLPPGDSPRHACDVGQGQRRHRRRWIRRAGHPRRRGRDDPPHHRQHDADRGQQRPGARGRHSPGSGQARERHQDGERIDGRDAAGVAHRGRADRAGAVGGRDHADAAQPARHRSDDDVRASGRSRCSAGEKRDLRQLQRRRSARPQDAHPRQPRLSHAPVETPHAERPERSKPSAA